MQERHKSGWKPSFFFGLLRFSIFLSFPSTQIDPKRRDAPHLKKLAPPPEHCWCFGWTYFEIQVA